jgi:hypothetical protein
MIKPAQASDILGFSCLHDEKNKSTIASGDSITQVKAGK